MKQLYLFALCLLLSPFLQAQIYSENFDSYNVNDYMGVVNPTYWSTWSGTTGGANDVKVTDANASSGNRSIYFASTTSGGGPQDVLLKMGSQFTSGKVTFEADFLIPTGKTAYWNFQATPVAGQTWALECNMSNGNISMGGNASGSYPVNSWFTLKIEANLTLGAWEFWVDGVSQGIWSNPVNSIAMVNFYPLQGSAFYVDDVSFDHVPYTLPILNAGAAGLDVIGNVAGQSVNPVAKVKNVGQNAINSFSVSLNYNGNTINENVTGITLASLAEYEVTFTSPITLIAGTNTAQLVISNVNGAGPDDDQMDDTLNLNVNPVVPAAGKMVVGEEGTGTWCQWCPRGAVYMEKWNHRYAGYFAPIAVHNNDPMADIVFDGGMATLISGYPSALVDRQADVDPSAMLGDIESRLQTAPAGTIMNGAIWDSGTRTLTVSLSTTFAASGNTAYRIACVLTEDGVTGTTSGYNQSNAYAGGGNGPMGGYENLPSSVPASMMVYDFVARGIAPSFDGMPNAFPASIVGGTPYIHNFSFVLPNDWDETQMHIIGMLIDPAGTINNASFTSIDDAVNNGFILGQEEENTSYFDGPDQRLKVFPNPSQGNAFALLDMEGSHVVTVEVLDLTGKRVFNREFGALNGAQTLPLNLEGMPAGLYQLVVRVDGKALTHKMVIE